MNEQTVTCPNCGKPFQLTDAIRHQMEEHLRAEYAAASEKQMSAAREQWAKDRARIEQQAKARAEENYSTDLKDLKEQLSEKSKQLASSQQMELDLRKRQRELEEREQALKLETARTLDAERAKIREEAAAKASDEHRLKDLEKDKKLGDMMKQIEDLKRKAEQGSQQTQGEVMELELEDTLRNHFHTDDIQPVAKGKKGADVLQTVRNSTGQDCGTLIWESKRTKTWSDGWIQKLKDDQREAKAAVAVIVSTALPKDIRHFAHADGVWVTDFESAMGLGTVLRMGLMQVAHARAALAGKNDKMELLYNYFSGPEFKQRVEAILESFNTMKDDLDTEKTAMTKIWAKREKQIQTVIHSTAGLHGDLQGIIGTALPSIAPLELPAGGENNP